MFLTPKQYEALEIVADPDVEFLLYGGAIRGAKTYFLIILFILLGLRYPRSRWCIIRADLPRIKRNLLPPAEIIAADPEIAPHVVKFLKDPLEIHLANGSVVMFMAENYDQDKELTRFAGLEVNGFGFDEIDEVQEKTFNKAFERVGSWLNAFPAADGTLPRSLIVGTCNPSLGWVKQRIYTPWREGKLPRNFRYLPARIYDNPFIPPGYVEEKRRTLSPGNFARFVEGDWEYIEKTGREWLHAFDFGRHTGGVPFLQRYPVKLTFDFNTLPYTTMLCIQIVEHDGLIWVRVFDEYCLQIPFATPEDCVRAFLADYVEEPAGYGYVPVEVYGDASGRWGYDAFRGIFAELRRYTHNRSDQVLTANPHLTDARDFLNDVLAEKYAIRMIVDRDRCPNLARDLDELQAAPVGFDKKKVDKVETRGHCYSALVYCLCQVFLELLRENRE